MMWLRRSLVIIVLLAALCALAHSAVFAGANSGHKIAVHVLSHGTSTCKSLPVITECGDIVTTYPDSGDVDVFPVFFGLDEYTVIEFGLTWPEEWGSCQYTVCTQTLNIGDIVNPGDGVASAWTTCQSSWSVVSGFGWLRPTGSGMVSIVPNSAGDYGTVDCAAAPGPYYDVPDSTYSAGIGGISGDDPCAEPEQEGGGESGGIRGYYR